MSVGALKVAKRPAAAGAAKTDPITDDAVESNNKYEAAMLLTHGDETLSRAVVNIDRGQNNMWKHAIHGDAPQELRDEWQGLQNCGFGNQKN